MEEAERWLPNPAGAHTPCDVFGSPAALQLSEHPSVPQRFEVPETQTESTLDVSLLSEFDASAIHVSALDCKIPEHLKVAFIGEEGLKGSFQAASSGDDYDRHSTSAGDSFIISLAATTVSEAEEERFEVQPGRHYLPEVMRAAFHEDLPVIGFPSQASSLPDHGYTLPKEMSQAFIGDFGPAVEEALVAPENRRGSATHSFHTEPCTALQNFASRWNGVFQRVARWKRRARTRQQFVEECPADRG